MDNFSEKIIKEIEARHVVPRPKWHFFVTRGVFWLLAIASVIIGGIAFAVAYFVFFDNDGMKNLQEAPIGDIAQSIPFVWLFVLGLFTACAYLGFRHTRKGYQYATALVVGIAIVASIAFGLLLDQFDFGQSVHKYLLQNTAFYDSLIHSSEDLPD